MNEEIETQYNVPKDAHKYVNEFIVFYADEPNPKIIHHSIFPDDAYKEALILLNKTGKAPVVIRINEPKNNISWLKAVRG